MLSKLKLFFGLSRTSHALLDVATPAMAALLYLGHFPELSTIILGLFTAFAGYTAVYALNDIVDVSFDRQRIFQDETKPDSFDIDGTFVQHPIAQGLISYRDGLLWFGGWGVAALAGAWLLNPYCGLLFLGSALLEVIYCKLSRISHFKIVPSALVKASGGVAGVLAVDPAPSGGFIFVLVLWLAAWEVGGQNIAHDIVDMDNDSRLSARTTSTVKGVRESVFFLVAACGMAFFGGVSIYVLSGLSSGWIYTPAAVIAGWFLIMDPSRRLYLNQEPANALRLFNRASYVPLVFLIITAISCIASA